MSAPRRRQKAAPPNGAGITLCMVFHNHQPVGNFGWVLEELWDHAYAPMIGALEAHPRVRAGLHYTGPLLDWIEQHQPAGIARIRALVDREQVEILGGGLNEPILISLHQRDRQRQLVRMADRLERTFARRPVGAWLAERVWEPGVASDLAETGYQYTILDDNHLRAANVPREAQWATWSTDDQGRRLTLFASEYGLRYAMPWSSVESAIEHLRANVTEDRSRIGMMGDDGEKFGGWPGTYELCFGAGQWIEHFFSAVEENAAWLATVRPLDWLASHAPAGRVYVPTASYKEMTEWALPSHEVAVFHDLVGESMRAGTDAQRFLNGGFWRAFQARYREINDLHKQMLRTSDAVEAMPVGPLREQALSHLLYGQSNDVYWHGLFGGIYLPHLRLAVQAELIGAYDLATGGHPPTLVTDLDLDGVDEVQLGAAGQSLVLDPAEGAGIGAWDLFATRLAIGSSMRRRPEWYHARLREYFAEHAALGTRAQASAADSRSATSAAENLAATDTALTAVEAAAVSTQEPVVLLQEGLDEDLVYDTHEQRGALVVIRDAVAAHALGAAELSQLEGRDLGDFVDAAFELVRADGARLEVRRAGSIDGVAATVTKSIELAGDRQTSELRVEVEVAGGPTGRALELDLSFAWNVAGGGGNPAAYYRWSEAGAELVAPHDGRGELASASGVAFGNRQIGVDVQATLSDPARITWYAIHTVSKSEGGYERVYQASSLHLRWPLKPAAVTGQRFGVTFVANQSRDLRQEEAEKEAG